MLETLRSDETLDTGSFGIRLLSFAFGLDFAANDELADLIDRRAISAIRSTNTPSLQSIEDDRLEETHIIILAQAEEFPNLGRSLRSQSLGQNPIGQTRDFLITLLDDTERQHTEIHAHNAAPNALSPPLTVASRSIA